MNQSLLIRRFFAPLAIMVVLSAAVVAGIAQNNAVADVEATPAATECELVGTASCPMTAAAATDDGASCDAKAAECETEKKDCEDKSGCDSAADSSDDQANGDNAGSDDASSDAQASTSGDGCCGSDS